MHYDENQAMAVVHALAHRQRNIGYRRHVSTCAGKKEAVLIGSCLYEGGYIKYMTWDQPYVIHVKRLLRVHA